MSNDRSALRATFDEDALLYDRARPTYPPAVFDAIFDRLSPAPGTVPRVLEIGCGTGRATRPLAQRGCEVVAVDLGADMAAVARRNLAGFDHVRIVHADVEQWTPDTAGFDLVLSATAFHWLDPATRFDRAARLLRRGGVLALIATIHIAGPSERFFDDAQRCYGRFDPDTPPGLRRPTLDELGGASVYGIETAAGLQAPQLHRFAADFHYTADEYLDLLRTFSNHRALPAVRLDGLLDCLRRRIDTEPGGAVTKSVAFEVSSAFRR